jgi:hypothetical protein
VFRYLKLLRYVHKINLSPQETLALIQRLETDSCRVEDYEVLIRVIRAHTELSADDLAMLPDLERSLSVSPDKDKRPVAKRARRRHRG